MNSEITTLFNKTNEQAPYHESVVSISQPEHFLENVDDVIDWLLSDIYALSALISVSTNAEGDKPSDELVSQCTFALGHLSEWAQFLRGLERDAKRQLKQV